MKNEIVIKYGIRYFFAFRIFGDKFVENNLDNFKMIIYGEEKELCSFYDFENYIAKIKFRSLDNINIEEMSKGEDKLKLEYEKGELEAEIKIKLKIIKNITDLSHMFNGCDLITSIEILPFDTTNIINMEYLFNCCKDLEKLTNTLADWNISNVNNIKYMFARCSSLVNIPDISNWDTSNINNMNGLFYACFSLESLPDISKWKIDN